MKNIHVLPTDKPSKLFYNVGGSLLFTNYENYNGVNTYITSDEEIKEDYVIAYGFVIKVMMFEEETLYFVNGTKAKREDCKKIILTTDQDLIKDGVQAIDDEFLEWFVDNPSCEWIKVEHERVLWENGEITHYKYKIIISKKEAKQTDEKGNPLTYWGGLEESKQEFPKQNIIDNWLEKNGDPEIAKQVEQEAKDLCKQETLEEAFGNWADQQSEKGVGYDKLDVLQFGFKWQQEKMYSEEEVKEILTECTSKLTESKLRWFEQFKKK